MPEGLHFLYEDIYNLTAFCKQDGVVCTFPLVEVPDKEHLCWKPREGVLCVSNVSKVFLQPISKNQHQQSRTSNSNEEASSKHSHRIATQETQSAGQASIAKGVVRWSSEKHTTQNLPPPTKPNKVLNQRRSHLGKSSRSAFQKNLPQCILKMRGQR